MKTLGRWLNQWRERRGLSQAEAGRMIRLSQPEMSRIETDARLPSLEQLGALLAAYEVPRHEWSVALAFVVPNDEPRGVAA